MYVCIYLLRTIIIVAYNTKEKYTIYKKLIHFFVIDLLMEKMQYGMLTRGICLLRLNLV